MVDLAADPGIVGPFLGAGDKLRPLLDWYRTLSPRHPEFLEAVRQALPNNESQPAADGREVLTEREKAILPYLATHLKALEIAAELYLSVNTVKTHQQSVYRKLGVSSRGAAVVRGRELGLLRP